MNKIFTKMSFAAVFLSGLLAFIAADLVTSRKASSLAMSYEEGGKCTTRGKDGTIDTTTDPGHAWCCTKPGGGGDCSECGTIFADCGDKEVGKEAGAVVTGVVVVRPDQSQLACHRTLANGRVMLSSCIPIAELQSLAEVKDQLDEASATITAPVLTTGRIDAAMPVGKSVCGDELKCSPSEERKCGLVGNKTYRCDCFPKKSSKIR